MDAEHDRGWLAQLEALDEIRLSRNWSYVQLSADMTRLNHPVGPKTLHAMLSRRAEPYDRTLYQIRGYLDAVREEKTPKRRVSA